MKEKIKNEKGRVFRIYYSFLNVYDENDNQYDNLKSIIKDGLNHRSIKKWFLINSYDVAEKELDEKEFKDFCEFHDHITVVIRCDVNIDINSISSWFKGGRVTKLTGRDVFIESINRLFNNYDNQFDYNWYLSETESNFDWLTELAEYQSKIVKKKVTANNKDVSDLERIKFEISYQGKPLSDYKELEIYSKNQTMLENLRLHYLKNNPPIGVINYYIYGKSGLGSVLYAKELASALYPNKTENDLLYFTIKADKGYSFLGYDGQPAINYIGFNNYNDLVNNIFNGSINCSLCSLLGIPKDVLIGKVNIIIADVPFEEFFKGRYYDLFLSFFPITNIINLDEDDFIKKFEERKKLLK